MIETGTLLQDRYLVEKQIGAGGMGAVYLAVDQRFDNYVAIKETFYQDEELKEAFEREARLLNGLQHPVLPHVSDYFAENNGYFLVMQFIEGEDLSDILKRDGAFSVAEVLRWTDNLLDALDFLHTQEPPIIHRDIKPHNLKLTKRGDIMLLDFGLAKLKSENTTGSLSVFGFSRTYSPLEQIQGTGTDARSDIFALGATVYHLLTGKPPVDALTRAAAIVNGKPDPIQPASDLNPEIPPALANIINTALALNPDHRFVSAKAMRLALEHVVADVPTEVVEAAPAPVTAAPPVVVATAADENFPALEAFAAGGAEVAPPIEEKNGADFIVELPQHQEQKTRTASVEPAHSTVVVDSAKTTRPKRFFKPAIAAVVLGTVIFGLAAFWLASDAKDSSIRTNQTAASETIPAKENSNAGVAETVLPTTAEPVAETKTKPVAAEKAVERRAVTEDSKKSENIAVEPPRSAPPRKTVGNGETRERVVNAPAPPSASASDIEAVFTGRRNRDSRRQPRRMKEDMSEEELEQLRRERKQRRWERRNRPLPF
jgi:tRNA A-37 threonylcarbamoyl transferase component Bud32